MSNSNVTHLIQKKNALEKLVVDCLSAYSYRFIIKTYDQVKLSGHQKDRTSKKLKEFQMSMLKISEWTDDKRDREFDKFLIWCEKKRKSGVRDALQSYFLLSMRVISHNNVSVQSLSTIAAPLPEEMFYKCMRACAKFYYNNLHDKDIFNSEQYNDYTLRSIVKSRLQKFIPIMQLFELMEKKEDTPLLVEYNYDDNNDPTESLHVNISTKSDKVKNDLELKHVSSEELENEYYMSEESESKKSNNNIKVISIMNKGKANNFYKRIS
jgi:hypothetical protein